MLEDHAHTFQQNQDRRQATFEQNVLFKWTTRDVDVIEGDIKFRDALRTFQTQADALETEHAEKFAQSLEVRAVSSWDAEQKREQEFLDVSKKQQEKFVAEMKQMEDKFHALLTEFMKSANEAEDGRTDEAAKFDAEQKKEVREQVHAWKQKFVAAREKRQTRMIELLHAF